MCTYYVIFNIESLIERDVGVETQFRRKDSETVVLCGTVFLRLYPFLFQITYMG